MTMNTEMENQKNPFAEAAPSWSHLTGIERDKAIWNAAIYWVSENAHTEV
jgi:hypothetical protein